MSRRYLVAHYVCSFFACAYAVWWGVFVAEGDPVAASVMLLMVGVSVVAAEMYRHFAEERP